MGFQHFDCQTFGTHGPANSFVHECESVHEENEISRGLFENEAKRSLSLVCVLCKCLRNYRLIDLGKG